MRCLQLSSLFLFGIFCLPAQDLKELEKKITDFTLPNGLHFIVLERHETPLVSFHTLVAAGSSSDPAGQTGMARMMELLGYKGTESIGSASWPAEKKALETAEEAWDRVDAELNKGIRTDPVRLEMLRSQARLANESAQRMNQGNEYARILNENGVIDLSAVTNFDSTSFSYSLPSNRIELWFLMESQRLLHPAFRDFYGQRDAMIEDYAKQLDSNSSAKLFAELLATAFKVHPYRNPLSGWASDVRSLRRNSAKTFFDRYYTPGNITISIVGDVVPAEARRMAERYFGPMEAKPPAPALHTEEPPQEGPKTVVVEANGPSLLAVAFKRPSQYDKDDAVFDVMQYALSKGSGGFLYRELVQEKHVAAQTQVGATLPSGRYPSLMVFAIQPAQGRTIDENQRALDECLTRFKNLNIDAQSLARAKAQLRVAFLRRISNNDFAASMLSLHAADYGDWRKLFSSLEDLNSVTADAIQRVAAKYLVATGRTTAYTVAPGQSALPPPTPRVPAERKTGGLQ